MSEVDSLEADIVSLTDAEMLLSEIDRLRAKIAQLEDRVARLHTLAHEDPLVGLPNRRSFFARLEELIARVERYGGPSAMLFVDMDGLKQINDRAGHVAGDEALKKVAQILVANVRKADSVARIGGDEFAILLERTDERGAWEMALRIVETVMNSEFCFDGTSMPLSVAVGVGLVQPGDTPQSVIKRADKAMYRIKAS